MTIDLEKLQEMWEKDSKIDRDNLHEESLNIPSLHAKYFELYNTIFLLRKKAEQQRKNIRHERYEYFSGKADPDVYIQNPFPKKIRDKDTMQKYLDADEKLSTVSLKIDYYDAVMERTHKSSFDSSNIESSISQTYLVVLTIFTSVY